MAQPWYWTRIPRVGAGPVVKQIEEEGCGPACGEMLLRDRGEEHTQEEIARGLLLPADGHRLAARMTAISTRKWLGGGIHLPSEPRRHHVEAISAARGTWADLLEPEGPGHVGHWVVIDGATSEGVVLVRDPVGSAYGMLIDEFLRLWSYAVLVTEDIHR